MALVGRIGARRDWKGKPQQDRAVNQGRVRDIPWKGRRRIEGKVRKRDTMNFDIPEDLQNYLSVLDDFIEAEIKPLENENDNIRFFDHRREDARTDWDRGGLPNEEWEALLGEARRRGVWLSRYFDSVQRDSRVVPNHL